MLSIKQVISFVARNYSGELCHKTTVLRWISRGCVNRRTGDRVKLAAEQVGGQFYVSEEDIGIFLKELNDA
jgi:hypothetical protein